MADNKNVPGVKPDTKKQISQMQRVLEFLNLAETANQIKHETDPLKTKKKTALEEAMDQ